MITIDLLFLGLLNLFGFWVLYLATNKESYWAKTMQKFLGIKD